MKENETKQNLHPSSFRLPPFVDSHAHIDGPEFDADRDEVIERARAAGVQAILNVGTGHPHSGALERAVELAESQASVFAAVGVHPHDARLFDDRAAERLKKLIKQSSRVVAWGEVGLDYHYDNSPRETQRDVFRRQLQLAREAGLPVIIHTREAEDDTIEILRSEWAPANLPGVLHCFSGSAQLAARAIDLGFSISFSGIVTFKKAQQLREIALQVPDDRLLIETDCPYLAPVPHRGKRNEPAFVVEVGRCLAELKRMEFAEFGALTTQNFARLFKTEA
jgi:TatD DNase family protein